MADITITAPKQRFKIAVGIFFINREPAKAPANP